MKAPDHLSVMGASTTVDSPTQLRDLLSTVDEPLDVEASGSAETGLDDLTPRELRSLLRALEG